jgi:hypothetical protein
MSDINLVRFRAAVAGALTHLESRRQEVNDLNVFPVADGDTGDNMALTLRAVLAELDRLQAGNEARTIDEIGREEIVQSVARAALLGARGNSGVILSQLIRGAAEELVSRPGQLIDAPLIGAALSNAAERAYTSVRAPAEGTILTVAREMAHQIVTDVAHSSEDARLGPTTEPHEQDRAIAAALERAVAAGQDSVKRGPELLSELRDAGVVDAGGYALTVIFAGVVAALRGEDPPELDHHAPARITHPQHSSSTYRYCTNFAVTGRDLKPAAFASALEEIGDSVLVVGDRTTLKVHVHTDEPERATSVFSDVGEVSHIDIADMRLQVSEREQRLASAPSANGSSSGANGLGGVPVGEGPPRVRCGLLAVTDGEGFKELFGELGAFTVDGGPTLNPSTYELLAGIHEVPAEEVLVLPASPNVVMAAERAAELSDKQVLVLAITSQQAGLAAAVALSGELDAQRNSQAITQAASHLRTGAVARAARDDPQGRFKSGQAIGFHAEQMIAWGEPRATLMAVLRALEPDSELISVLSGKDAPLTLTEIGEMGREELQVELECRHGGQHAYWWLLVAE